MTMGQMAKATPLQSVDSNAGLGIHIAGSGKLSDISNFEILPRDLPLGDNLATTSNVKDCTANAAGKHSNAGDTGCITTLLGAETLANRHNAKEPSPGALTKICEKELLSSGPQSASEEHAIPCDQHEDPIQRNSTLLQDPMGAVHHVQGVITRTSDAHEHQASSRSAYSRAFKSYPTSPTLRQRMGTTPRLSTRLSSRISNSKPGQAHRTSHSLGQVGSFAPLLMESRVKECFHASAPGSPAEKLNQQAVASFWHLAGQRQPICHPIGDCPSVLGGLTGYDGIARASSAYPASPSTSMTSASICSISPIGSSRLNADGSFTSHDASFDSLSIAPSESLSRASSTFDELHHIDSGSKEFSSSARTTKQKVRLRNIDRKLICDFSHAHPDAKQDTIASQFGIERSTVSKILKQKEKWRAIDPHGDLARVAKHRAVKFPAVEERLTLWVAQLRAEGTMIKDAMIRKEALSIAKEYGIAEDKFKASGGWIEKFRERQGLPKISSRSNSAFATTESSIMTDAQTERLMRDALSPWDAPDMDQAKTANAETNASQPQTRPRGEAPSFSPTTDPNTFDHMRSTCYVTSNGATAFLDHVVYHHDGQFAEAPASATASSGPKMLVQHDSRAAAHYAMNTVSGSSPVKRRRTEPSSPFPPIEYHFDPTFQFHFSAGTAQQPTMCFTKQPELKHGQDEHQVFISGTHEGVMPVEPPFGKKRGRGRHLTVSNSEARNQTKLSLPLRLSVPNVLSTPGEGIASSCESEDLASTHTQGQSDDMQTDASISVSTGQAQQSLDLVLKFLNEQPKTLLPSEQLAVIGRLQADTEQLARPPLDTSAEGTNPSVSSDTKSSKN